MTLNKSLLLYLILIILFASHAHAFGAGNIASIARIEGQNWRHGDIEDMLKKVAFIKRHKWTSLMVKRAYFGNWLRDYSQAVDVGTLKGVQADTIRILVWILAFMSFGYATNEFEVTSERLGVYRPEEHIDNPKDYADNQDARQYDSRLRPPVAPEELAIDLRTGMKNYIANEQGGWATSLGYVKHTFMRSIHFGRTYTNGTGGTRGEEADLYEALRCLGQGLHTLEDFGAHTNYTELALRELGFNNVFPHVGTATQVQLGGKTVFPLVTGTFGGVDFLHSVLGEAGDHVAQSEVDEVNNALGNAQSQTSNRGLEPEQQVSGLVDLLQKIPGTDGLCQEAVNLQRASDVQEVENSRGVGGSTSYSQDTCGGERAGLPSFQGPPQFDNQATIAKIYPILAFRDNVMRTINGIISKIPGLETLVETISEKITLFIMGLLAPYIKPIIATASQQLKMGSSAVVNSSAKHQYEPWTDPHCTDPTHSLLSKDHFSNILNNPAGHVASEILQYVAPRVLYAWDNPGVPVDQVLADVERVFHHPVLRQQHCEIHMKMFAAVETWLQHLPDRGGKLNHVLSAESVREGKNHIASAASGQGHAHGSVGAPNIANLGGSIFGLGSHSKVSGSPFSMLGGGGKRELGADLEDPSAYAVPVAASTFNDPMQQPPNQQYYASDPYPTDYTPADTTTYSTSYAQGFTDNQPSTNPGYYQEPYYDFNNPYPPQQQPVYETYPPTQSHDPQGYGYDQTQQQSYYENNPYPSQQAFDITNQQGYSGASNQQQYPGWQGGY